MFASLKLDYPEPVRELIAQLKQLPGIGLKSAERMAVWLLQQERQVPKDLATAILDVCREVSCCPTCGFFATEGRCDICDSPRRDATMLCIVEQPTDVLPIEHTGVFSGLYHCLGGRLSPLDNIGPEDLRIEELRVRLREGQFQEVILALSSDVSGEATTNYLVESLGDFQVQISRLAQGMPVGGGLETADSLTLHRAIENRGKVAGSPHRT